MPSRLLDWLGALVAPERCAACDAHVPFGTVFCRACAATAVVDPGAETAVDAPFLYAPFLYGGAVAAAVTRFKYLGRADLARPLSHLLHRALPELRRLSVDLVVPIPLHRTRLAERGFNQAALLARPLARWLGAAFAPRALTRVLATAPQASLRREARQANVREAFAPREQDGRFFEGRRVLLVDDVATTGATLAAAADAARAGHAQSVHAVVVARATPM